MLSVKPEKASTDLLCGKYGKDWKGEHEYKDLLCGKYGKDHQNTFRSLILIFDLIYSLLIRVSKVF